MCSHAKRYEDKLASILKSDETPASDGHRPADRSPSSVTYTLLFHGAL